METTEIQTAAPESAALMYFFGSTASNGITIGSPLSVPPGYAALIVMGKKTYDAVGPGDYTIDAQHFPQLGQKLRLQPGELPKRPAEISVYLMNITAADLPWRAAPIVTKNHEHGLTYCALSGHCVARVIDPAGFYNALQAGWGKMLKKQTVAVKSQLAAASPGKQAEVYALSVIDFAAGVAFDSLKLVPEQIASSSLALNQSVGGAVASMLRDIGVECTAFEISNAPEVKRTPCAKCGSVIAPTAYGVYRRTISLLYVRFGAKREGNFCVPCAAMISAAYNGTMLVCGWWGYIGLVLTPVYLIQNCYYFSRAALGPKVASGTAYAEEQEGVWPPSPAAQWGQEEKE